MRRVRGVGGRAVECECAIRPHQKCIAQSFWLMFYVCVHVFHWHDDKYWHYKMARKMNQFLLPVVEWWTRHGWLSTDTLVLSRTHTHPVWRTTITNNWTKLIRFSSRLFLLHLLYHIHLFAHTHKAHSLSRFERKQLAHCVREKKLAYSSREWEREMREWKLEIQIAVALITLLSMPVCFVYELYFMMLNTHRTQTSQTSGVSHSIEEHLWWRPTGIT